MRKRYRKSYLKVSILIICCIAILIATVAYLIISMIGQIYKTSTIVLITSSFIALIIVFMKVKPQFKEEITIDEKEISSTGNESIVQIHFDTIDKIQYYGTKIVPMSEMISIHSGLKTIYIDFNFKNYRSIWKEVVKRCEGVENITIDPRIYKRLP